ncbi:serine hydrolase domain-containing protein [Actinokineospora sp. HUAS TT18]|uniref:serine hydrolase domain-containing protein n=1 Tax=Actinokineospora sp. HUAS TT18 TaxID=3447451 RepID=UPI003F5245D7
MRRGMKNSVVAAVTAVAALVGTTQAAADVGVPTVNVDTAKVAQYLNQKLGNGNSVGYAFAVSKNGQYATSGSGGDARLDKDVAFTPYTRMEIASATKNVIAAALLKLVEKRGVGIDAKIWAYLPWDMWANMHPSWKDLSIKDLLAHTSGVGQLVDSLQGDLNVQATYEGIKYTLTKPIVVGSARNYENQNYAIARILIPELWDLTEPTRGVPDTIGPSNSGVWTLAYVNERLFAPAGIAPVACSSANPDTAPLAYDINNLATPGYLWDAGSLNCPGHRGLQMSAMDLVRWQAHLRHGTVVSPAVRDQMDLYRLGWDQDDNDAAKLAWAGAYRHGGDLNATYSRELHTCQAKFPGGVEAALLVNSRLLGSDRCRVLLDAVKAATS